MQLIAMMTMLIDHIGYIFFPNELLWRIIGRIALPLYAFGIILGYRNTSNLKKYFLRLFMLAMIAQLPYMLAFSLVKLNVIFTLLMSLMVVVFLDKYDHIIIRSIIIIISIFAMEIIPMDYGAYCLLLALIYRYSQTFWTLLLHFILNVIYWLYVGIDIQMMSLISTLLIISLPQFTSDKKLLAPVWLWRSFYPAHLCVLAILAILIK